MLLLSLMQIMLILICLKLKKGETGNDGTKNVEVMVLLKYLGNFLENFSNTFNELEISLDLN